MTDGQMYFHHWALMKSFVVLTAIEALISGLCESSGPWSHNLLVSLCTHTLIPDIQVMSRTASFSFKGRPAGRWLRSKITILMSDFRPHSLS